MSSETVLARRYLISGRVQGVGFRFFTKRAADQIGVLGWVRNLADGRVEAQATGTGLRLDEFRLKLEQGPSGSRVDDIEEIPLNAQPTWDQFEITF